MIYQFFGLLSFIMVWYPFHSTDLKKTNVREETLQVVSIDIKLC